MQSRPHPASCYRVNNPFREPEVALCTAGSARPALDRPVLSRQATCFPPDQSPKPCSKFDRPCKRGHDWRLEYLWLPKALVVPSRMAPVNSMTSSNESFSSLVFLSGFSSGRLIFFWLSRLALLQPKLHQLDFGLLVGYDFLSEPAHLRILPVQELRFCHIDCRLMMRKHQSDKIDIAIAGSLNGSHGDVHLFHARDQLRPIGIDGCLTAVGQGF